MKMNLTAGMALGRSGDSSNILYDMYLAQQNCAACSLEVRKVHNIHGICSAEEAVFPGKGLAQHMAACVRHGCTVILVSFIRTDGLSGGIV
jgi:hypothetical protein